MRGDTIIEVLLAVAVFSMVSVGAMTIMNQGTNAAQRALEITLVRQQIDAQAESLRAAHQAYTKLPTPEQKALSQWEAIRSIAEGKAAAPSDAGCPELSAGADDAFIMNPRNAQLVTQSNWFENMNVSQRPYSQFDSTEPKPAHGIWIEREEISSSSVVSAQEFTIRTCWYGAGMGSTPMSIDTVVRLYDPAT